MVLLRPSLLGRHLWTGSFALTWLVACDWLALMVVLPALLALPLQEGTDYFCINGIV